MLANIRELDMLRLVGDSGPHGDNYGSIEQHQEHNHCQGREEDPELDAGDVLSFNARRVGCGRLAHVSLGIG